MKKAIIITSAIEVNNDYPLTYSNVRSFFNTEERLRQTVATIAGLDAALDNDTTMYLVDISENSSHYGSLFYYQSKNLKYISVKEQMSDIWKDVTTHKNKSYCEQLIIFKFIETYKEELEQYDFYMKLSGRYLIDGNFKINFFDTVSPGFYFKPPLKFDWNDSWGYSLVDRRHIQGDNKLYQYCSVIYGWSKEFMDQYRDISRVIIEYCSHPSGMSYDVETLLYFFTRQFENYITETPWIIYGWDGTSGRFLRY